MSGEYFIPEAPWTVNVNMLPTERLHEIVQAYHRMAEALIEIGAAPFVQYTGEVPWCFHCTMSIEDGCQADCPGLLARRALGVA